MRKRRWQAIGITVLVGALALGAAATGWWYARESPPHQGPLILLAVDGLSARDLGAGTFPVLDGLAAESVAFTRVYAHTPQRLPGYTTLLTGRLPFEHGVRDDGGFVLRSEVRTLAELLRNRGFQTGAAVSTYLLRRETGIAQGFSFFDSELSVDADGRPAISRPAGQTVAVALKWLASQSGQRFFLFLELPKEGANAALAQMVTALKTRGIYDPATLMVLGGRGGTADAAGLDDASLRVAFVVKQPRGALAGRSVTTTVQLADVVPTILDLVRAPLPGGLHGRSLRPLLDDAEDTVPARPVYAESLAAYYRLGSTPLFALVTETRRLVRGVSDVVETESGGSSGTTAGEPVPDSVPLGAVLDELVAGNVPAPASPVSLTDEAPLARAGFLAGPTHTPGIPTTAVAVDAAVLETHGRAAHLVGEARFAEAIAMLRSIVKTHPNLGAVHYQIGQLLNRTGRLDEAAAAFTRAEAATPETLPVALALSDALRRAGKLADAKAHAEAAIVRAERGTPADRVAAHEIAARVALALKDAAAATSHATVSAEADPSSQLPHFVKGRLLFDEGKFEEALAAFSEPAPAAGGADEVAPVAELQWYKGQSLARLDRSDDAEAAFRSEIAAFPRDPRAYLSLASLYQATKPAELETVLADLMEAMPTPEGYGLAAAAWASSGDTRRADAIRADGRVRFRGDPTLGRLRSAGGRR